MIINIYISRKYIKTNSSHLEEIDQTLSFVKCYFNDNEKLINYNL